MVLSEMIASFLRVKALPTSLFLYAVAVLTTMAGMEIFGWLSVLLGLVVTWQSKSANFPRRPILMAGDYSLLALLVIIVCAHHHPDEILDFLINGLDPLPTEVEVACLFLPVV
jgi:hypothetical protein